MTNQRQPDGVPEIRVVKQAGWPRRRWANRPLSTEVAAFFDPLRPIAEGSLRFVIGMWPLVVVIALASGLIWSAAMGQSP
jgi:hypothetical protein